MKIFIANLNPICQARDLIELFSHFGYVSDCNVVYNQRSGHSRRYAFVQMPCEREALEACKNYNRSSFQGFTIVARLSPVEVQKKEKTTNFTTGFSPRILRDTPNKRHDKIGKYTWFTQDL